MKSTASSMLPLPPMASWSLTSSSVTSVKPASVRTERTWSGSPKANGPGAPGGGGPDAPAGWGRCSRMVVIGTRAHSLCATSCQHTKTSRPPGQSTSCTLRNAATGSVKNITPNRLIAALNGTASLNVCASATSNRAFPTPASTARWRARSIIAFDRSMPTASPVETTPAAASVVAPQPHPMSRTRSVEVERDRPEDPIDVWREHRVVLVLRVDPVLAVVAVPVVVLVGVGRISLGRVGHAQEGSEGSPIRSRA